MAIILLVLAIIVIAALAPRFGADSRDFGHGRTDNHIDYHPTHPDHRDTWVTSFR